MTTLIALDVDGVLNPHSPEFGDEAVRIEAPYQGSFNLRRGLIERLHSQPDAEIWWLTTWLDDACEAFDGVIDARGYLNSEVSDDGGWWKYDALAAFLMTRPDITTVIWIDDELIKHCDLPALRSDWRTCAPHPLVGITPDGLTGVGL